MDRETRLAYSTIVDLSSQGCSKNHNRQCPCQAEGMAQYPMSRLTSKKNELPLVNVHVFALVVEDVLEENVVVEV